jgi:hypothetical protein
MKQTAVEWLRDLYENQPAYDEFILDEQWQKAIEMEKEQIINANRDGVDMVVDKKDFISGEQYYNETFNTNEK